MRRPHLPSRLMALAVAAAAVLVPAVTATAVPAPSVQAGSPTPVVLPARTATSALPHARANGISPSDGLDLGPGARATVTVTVDQRNIREQALARLRYWRQDALDHDVPWMVNGQRQTVADYLRANGISREEYLNPRWSSSLERIALQRAVEAWDASRAHTRPNGTPWYTAQYQGTRPATEILAWGTSNVTASIDMWALEKAAWVGQTGGITGHYTALIDPRFVTYGFAGASSIRWAGVASGAVTTNDRSTSWYGSLTFTVPLTGAMLDQTSLPTEVTLEEGTQRTITVNQRVEADHASGDQRLLALDYVGSLSSADPMTASVNGMTVSAVRPGTTTLTFTSGSEQRTVRLRVVPAGTAVPSHEIVSVDHLTIRCATADCRADLPSTVTAHTRDGRTHKVPVTWQSLQLDADTVTGWVPGWDATAVATVFPPGTDGNPVELTGQGRWVQQGGQWWFRLHDGSYPRDTWARVNGAVYLFDADGWIVAGTRLTIHHRDRDGDVYSFTSSGARVTGWYRTWGSWYYFDPDTGRARKGWLADRGIWYYLGSDGVMSTGWINLGGTWYYLHPSGAMATGWINLGGTWYYLHPSGAMAASTVINGYRLSASGAWV